MNNRSHLTISSSASSVRPRPFSWGKRIAGFLSLTAVGGLGGLGVAALKLSLGITALVTSVALVPYVIGGAAVLLASYGLISFNSKANDSICRV